MGKNDIEDALKRLDRLTQEEARMASAQLLEIANAIDSGVRQIADDMLVVDNRVASVGDQVRGVGEQVQGVGNRVASVGNQVQGVDNRVTAVMDGA
jgi:hypothetical protein